MKTVILLLQFILTSSILLAQKIDDPLYNKTKKTVSVSFELGVGLGTKAGIDVDYSSKTGWLDTKANYSSKMGLGINPRLNINTSKNFSLVPGFIYFFTNPPSDDIDVNYWQLNFNIHYGFSEEVPYYVIAGLNYSYAEVGAEIVGVKIAANDGEIGANLGFGIKSSRFDAFSYFGEIKYDTAFDQITFTIGISFLPVQKSPQMPDDIYF